VTVAVDGISPFEGIVSAITSAGTAATSGDADATPDGAQAITAAIDSAGEPLGENDVGRAASITAARQVLASSSLLVPLSAVSVDENGTQGSVLVRDGGGTFTRVAVTVIAVSEGIAAIKAEDGAVVAGAIVRLG
jgi:hypothetical protein